MRTGTHQQQTRLPTPDAIVRLSPQQLAEPLLGVAHRRGRLAPRRCERVEVAVHLPLVGLRRHQVAVGEAELVALVGGGPEAIKGRLDDDERSPAVAQHLHLLPAEGDARPLEPLPVGAKVGRVAAPRRAELHEHVVRREEELGIVHRVAQRPSAGKLGAEVPLVLLDDPALQLELDHAAQPLHRARERLLRHPRVVPHRRPVVLTAHT
mmetsp:Transcript_15652/g.50175  ORF Transcript_15652/g.50175 Transcript_15652/m.50175 type:complete len:209 (+) Transcript_15652:121-747(+)